MGRTISFGLGAFAVFLVAFNVEARLRSLETPWHSRIIGGSQVTKNDDFKFYGSVQHYGFPFCGATLIDPKWAVTAAHCVDDIKDVAGLRVVFGSKNVAHSDGKAVRVNQVVIHENYSTRSKENDIALIELKEEVHGIQVAILDDGTNFGPGTIMNIVGFGATESGGQGNEELLETSVEWMSYEKCTESGAYFGWQIHDDVMICIGREGGGRDACQGDSGGPAFRDGVISGIVSWGVGCGRPKKYGVYSRVSAFVSWIHGHIGTPQTAFISEAPTTAPTQTPGNSFGGLCMVGSSEYVVVPVRANKISDGVKTYKPNFEHCWAFTPPPGEQLEVEFPMIDTEREFDFLDVFEYNPEDGSHNLLERFHGSRKDVTVTIATGWVAILRLRTDATGNNEGFEALVSTKPAVERLCRVPRKKKKCKDFSRVNTLAVACHAEFSPCSEGECHTHCERTEHCSIFQYSEGQCELLTAKPHRKHKRSKCFDLVPCSTH